LKPDEGLKYGGQAAALAATLGWKKGIAGAEEALGANYIYKSDFQNALANYFAALKIYEELDLKKNITLVCIGIGWAYNCQGNYPLALEYDFKALKMAEELDYKALAVRLNGNIGNVYADLADYQLALQYSLKAVKMAEEMGNKQFIESISPTIAEVYAAQGDYPRGLEYCFKSLKIAEEIVDKQSVAMTSALIGLIYAKQHDYSQAVAYQFKSLKASQEIGNKQVEGQALLNIADNYLHIVTHEGPKTASHLNKQENTISHGQMQYLPTTPGSLIPKGRTALIHKAKEYLNQAQSYGRETGSLVLLQDALGALSRTDSLLGDYKGAYFTHLQCTIIKDSVFSKEKSVQIARLQNQKKTETDSLRIAQERHVTKIRYEQQRNYTYLSMAGVLALLGFSFITLRNNKRVRRAKGEAELQRNRAEQSERFKQQFLANMSHEIRTPMNAVLGMTSLTLDTDLSDKQRKYMNAVKRSSENLLVIINDILDLSKLEAGKMELERIPFRLSEQIKQVYDTMQFKAEEKGLLLATEIAEDVPDMLLGDPSRLNQVLINLTGNAIKFTEKGTVSIIVEKMPGTEAAVRFRVIDQGIGMPIRSGVCLNHLARPMQAHRVNMVAQVWGCPYQRHWLKCRAGKWK